LLAVTEREVHLHWSRRNDRSFHRWHRRFDPLGSVRKALHTTANRLALHVQDPQMVPLVRAIERLDASLIIFSWLMQQPFAAVRAINDERPPTVSDLAETQNAISAAIHGTMHQAWWELGLRLGACKSQLD